VFDKSLIHGYKLCEMRSSARVATTFMLQLWVMSGIWMVVRFAFTICH